MVTCSGARDVKPTKYECGRNSSDRRNTSVDEIRVVGHVHVGPAKMSITFVETCKQPLKCVWYMYNYDFIH